MENIIVVCNSKKEYDDCYDKSIRLYKIKEDNYHSNMINEELKIYQLPIFLIIEEDCHLNINIDWCVDKLCFKCACHQQCSTHKRMNSYDFMTNSRKKKLERILNV